MRSGEDSPASLRRRHNTGIAVKGYKANSTAVENGRHWLPPTVGETLCLIGHLPPPFSGCLKLILLDLTSGCYSAPGKQKKTSDKFPELRFASWNVWAMCPGHSEDLQQIADTRKSAIIDKELLKLDVSVTALQKTRLATSGSLR